MEVCPKCGNHSLEYHPHSKSARCLRMECDYRECMDYSEYSIKFEKEEKNATGRLSLTMNNRVMPT